MNNEPVAWMTKLYSPDIGEWWDWSDREKEGYTPLYTHPVKEQELLAEIEALKAEIVTIEKNTDYWADKAIHPVKELTDEEIYEIAKECKAPWHTHAIDPMMFARAILRKAQEK